MDDCHSERRKGVLLLDEVDMLLHPLRSELNFPIGVKRSIGPAPHRWDLAWSILDAIFCAAEIALSSNVPAIDEDDEDDDGDFAVEEREDVHAGEGVNGRGARHADEHDDDGFEVEGREGPEKRASPCQRSVQAAIEYLCSPSCKRLARDAYQRVTAVLPPFSLAGCAVLAGDVIERRVRKAQCDDLLLSRYQVADHQDATGISLAEPPPRVTTTARPAALRAR